MLHIIAEDLIEIISGAMGSLFTVFVNIVFLIGILFFLVAAQNVLGSRKRISWGIFYGIVGLFLIAFSFILGNPFGLSFLDHGNTGISY